MTEVEDIGEGVLYTYISDNGFLESGYREDDGPEDRFTYSFSVTEHTPPAPWQGQKGEQITTDSTGDEIHRVGFEWRSRGITSTIYDGCSFDVLPIETYYYEPEGTTMVEFAWLVDLEVPLNVGFADASGGTTRLPLSIDVVGE